MNNGKIIDFQEFFFHYNWDKAEIKEKIWKFIKSRCI